MNSLSWLLYFADVASAADKAVTPLAAVCIIGSGALTVIRAVALSCASDDMECDAGQFYKTCGPILKTMLPIGLVCMVLSWAVPEKDTIYAIAASEMGEEVLKSETVTKAHKALDAWLDKQIGEQEKAK